MGLQLFVYSVFQGARKNFSWSVNMLFG